MSQYVLLFQLFSFVLLIGACGLGWDFCKGGVTGTGGSGFSLWSMLYGLVLFAIVEPFVYWFIMILGTSCASSSILI